MSSDTLNKEQIFVYNKITLADDTLNKEQIFVFNKITLADDTLNKEQIFVFNKITLVDDTLNKEQMGRHNLKKKIKTDAFSASKPNYSILTINDIQGDEKGMHMTSNVILKLKLTGVLCESTWGGDYHLQPVMLISSSSLFRRQADN